MSGAEPENGLPVWRLNQILLILQIRMESIMNDHDRKSGVPISWSVLHMHTTTQLAKLLAIKRGCDVELAAMVAAFHDVYSYHTGKWEDHWKKADPYVREIVTEYNEVWGEQLGVITEAEVKQIIKAIKGHSDKEMVCTVLSQETLVLKGFRKSSQSLGSLRMIVTMFYRPSNQRVPKTV